MLAGQVEFCTLEAMTNVTVYEISQSSLAPLLGERPAMAEEIAASLSHRVEKARGGIAAASGQDRSAGTFLKAIRTIFRSSGNA